MSQLRWDKLDLAIFERLFHPEREEQSWSDIANQFGVNLITVRRRKREIFKSKRYKTLQRFIEKELEVLEDQLD